MSATNYNASYDDSCNSNDGGDDKRDNMYGDDNYNHHSNRDNDCDGWGNVEGWRQIVWTRWRLLSQQ